MKTIFGPAGNAVSFAQAGFQATKMRLHGSLQKV